MSASSDVLPEFREYERTLAAVANAYVQPAMTAYAASLAALSRTASRVQPSTSCAPTAV